MSNVVFWGSKEYWVEKSLKNPEYLNLLYKGVDSNNERYLVCTYDTDYDSMCQLLADIMEYTYVLKPNRPKTPKKKLSDIPSEQELYDIEYNNKLIRHEKSMEKYNKEMEEYNDYKKEFYESLEEAGIVIKQS